MSWSWAEMSQADLSIDSSQAAVHTREKVYFVLQIDAKKKKKNECLLLVPEKKFVSGYWSNFVPFLDTQHSSSSVNVSEMSSDLRQQQGDQH